MPVVETTNICTSWGVAAYSCHFGYSSNVLSKIGCAYFGCGLTASTLTSSVSVQYLYPLAFQCVANREARRAKLNRLFHLRKVESGRPPSKESGPCVQHLNYRRRRGTRILENRKTARRRELNSGRGGTVNRFPATRERQRRQIPLPVACQKLEPRKIEHSLLLCAKKRSTLPGENRNRAGKARNPVSLRKRTSKPTSLKRTVRGISTATACFRLPMISSTSYSLPSPLPAPPPPPSSSASPVPRRVVVPLFFFTLVPSADCRSTAEEIVSGLSWVTLPCDGDFRHCPAEWVSQKSPAHLHHRNTPE